MDEIKEDILYALALLPLRELRDCLKSQHY